MNICIDIYVDLGQFAFVTQFAQSTSYCLQQKFIAPRLSHILDTKNKNYDKLITDIFVIFNINTYLYTRYIYVPKLKFYATFAVEDGSAIGPIHIFKG